MAVIAVVEDEPEVRELIRDVLLERRHQVSVFSNLGEAIEGLKDLSPDLLITDIGLPDGCGLELVPSLKSIVGRQVPTIVLSALSEEHDFARGFSAGAVDYLTKPFSPAELLARCAFHLSRADAPGATIALTLAIPEQAGLAFGRYQVERELGRGGFGQVLLARDMGRQGELVALKVLGPHGNSDEETRRRFIRETYTLATMRAPNVALIRDIGVAEGRPYYAMEYIPGPTLSQHVRAGGVLSEADAMAVATGLLRALCALARVGLVHRDLKPNNVVLRAGDCGRPVLVDFGLAKRPFDRAITSSEHMVGTPGYISPEVINGREPDCRSDLFSLALTIRFALVGEHLFPDLTGVPLLQAMLERPVPPAGGLLSPRLERFLSGCLARDPEQRPSNPEQALALLTSGPQAR